MKMNQISLILLLVTGLFVTTTKPANDGVVFQWNLSEGEKSLYIVYKIGQFMFDQTCILAKTAIENPKITTGVIGCTAVGVMINRYLKKRRPQHIHITEWETRTKDNNGKIHTKYYKNINRLK